MGSVQIALRTATDVDLAAGCARGDRAAQRALFDREVDHVHAALYRIVGPARDVEDLVQETFFEVFRSVGSYRGEAKLSTWIGRVTAHVAYRYLSDRPRRAALRLDDIPEPVAAGGSPERRALAREAIRRLYAILDELDAKVRLAFALQVLDGHSLQEVAAMMDSSVVATKSRVWRARRRLLRDPAVAALLGGNASQEATR